MFKKYNQKHNLYKITLENGIYKISPKDHLSEDKDEFLIKLVDLIIHRYMHIDTFDSLEYKDLQNKCFDILKILKDRQHEVGFDILYKQVIAECIAKGIMHVY